MPGISANNTMYPNFTAYGGDLSEITSAGGKWKIYSVRLLVKPKTISGAAFGNTYVGTRFPANTTRTQAIQNCHASYKANEPFVMYNSKVTEDISGGVSSQDYSTYAFFEHTGESIYTNTPTKVRLDIEVYA